MPTIAIIAEGVTDQVFLEDFLFRVFEFEEEPEFIFAQPIRDVTHSFTAPHGGWELVLEYCEERFLDAAETSDFVIVQIDTDCGDHPNFGLDLSPGGVDRSDADLRSGVISILRKRIGSEVFDRFVDRTIFAVCVHSLESWIFFCVSQNHRTKNAFNALKRHMKDAKFEKAPDVYSSIVRRIRSKDFLHLVSGEMSLGMFLSDFAGKIPGTRQI